MSGLARREMLRRSLLTLAVTALPRSARAESLPVRLSTSSPGTAGGVWRPLVDRAPEASRLAINWIGGDPGGIETQLIAGALDVSAFGALGATEAALHGTDATIFSPGLNNHGRWIVRNDSAYRTPADLRGKRIATLAETSDTYRQARMAAALNKLDLVNDFQVIHGPPTANLALFKRGDVEAVIAIEPTATRLIGAGAREIARVGDQWRAAIGDTRPLFLVGQTATARWLTEHRATAAVVAKLFSSVNEQLHAQPDLLVEFHAAFGIPDTETAAIRLLPSRLRDIYATDWDTAVFSQLDRQVDVAVKLGILEKRAPSRIYATVA